MGTQTHFLVSATVGKLYKKNGEHAALPPLNLPGLLVGGFMPDVPLFLLTMLYFWQNDLFGNRNPQELFGPAYDTLYFTDPLWIVSHNLLHGPLMVALWLALGYVGWRRGGRWGPVLFWFAVSCGLHTLLNIPTHHNDGPLLLFPFDWQTRFNSPVSYWNPRYYGNIVAPIEMGLNVVMVVYLIGGWVRRRLQRLWQDEPHAA